MGCYPGLLDDHGGNHAEHPVVAFYMAEDVAVACPDTGFVGTDQYRIALAGRRVDGVGQVRIVEEEADLAGRWTRSGPRCRVSVGRPALGS